MLLDTFRIVSPDVLWIELLSFELKEQLKLWIQLIVMVYPLGRHVRKLKVKVWMLGRDILHQRVDKDGLSEGLVESSGLVAWISPVLGSRGVPARLVEQQVDRLLVLLKE